MLDVTPEQPRKVWAHQGESVTCIKGHAVCTVARTIMVGDPRNGGDFINWQQPEPDRSESVADLRCKKCRGAWIRGNPKDGFQFHFAAPPHDEWRDNARRDHACDACLPATLARWGMPHASRSGGWAVFQGPAPKTTRASGDPAGRRN